MTTIFIRKLSTLMLFFALCIPSLSFATDEASIELVPRNPKPYTPVKATLVSYLFNVNTALITWKVDGKVLLHGVGEKRITISTRGVGDKIPVHVTAVTANNETTEIDLVITPESVDILYETPESYTPLFYEGRSLPGEGALVKFVAMPNISENSSRLSPSSLSYSWYVNGELVDSASGIGRQSAMLSLDLLSNYTSIKVVAFSPRGNTAENSIDIYPHEVMPLLYGFDDILGIIHTTMLGKRIEKTKDFTLALEPFYLSTKGTVGDSAFYTWTLDGLPTTPLGGRILALRPKENSFGARSLSIEVGNTKRKLQKISTDLSLIFDTR